MGFDISYAYKLARDLGVSIQFVPFAWPTLARDLVDHRFDVGMSGIYETHERIQALNDVTAVLRKPACPDRAF